MTPGADMPESVVLNMQSRSHLAWGGYLGKAYDPFLGNQAGSVFKLPRGLDQSRMANRHSLQQQFDRLRRELGHIGLDGGDGPLRATSDRHRSRRRAQAVFDLEQEPQSVRERLARTPGASRRCWRDDWSKPA